MLSLFLVLAAVVAAMLTYLRVVQVVVDPDGAVSRLLRLVRVACLARRELADLDREYASLVDEHRHSP